MKKIIFSFAILAITFNINAQGLSQSDDAAIEQRTRDFLKLIEGKNYTSLLDYIYPELFNHTSKSEMFQIFNLLEQAGIELQFNNLKILNKKALPSDNDIKYTMIKYNMDMTLPLNTDDLKGIAALLVPTLQNNFGKENVEYNKTKSYINVKGEKFLLGVEDPKYKDWMFIIYDDSFKTAIEKTLPAEVNKAAASSAY